MKRIRISPEADCYATLSDVPECTPIFAVKDGKIKGMLVDDGKSGKPDKWIIKIGGSCGSSGYYETREESLRSSLEYYDYYVIDPEIKQ